MRPFLLFAVSLLIGMGAGAQNSWKVSLNGKTVLQATEESEEKNVIRIKAADLLKKADFSLIYKGDKQKGWARTVAAFDTTGAELKKQPGSTFRISNAALRALLKKSGTVKIYTWALPTDPAMQAVVRIRRVHLCTLVLQ